jgi:hypothetical protein
VRGYEDIKLAAVDRFRRRAEELMEQLEQPRQLAAAERTRAR